MSEMVNTPGRERGLYSDNDETCRQQDSSVIRSLASVTINMAADERSRLTRRRNDYSRGFDEGLYNEGEQIMVGPACDELYPHLISDQWEYTAGSPIYNIEPREMLASTVLAVLPYADEYTTVIGEDRAGRIPALIMAKAINTLRERHGLEKARRVFISGRIENTVPDFKPKGQDDRSLVVTEYIWSGESIIGVLSALTRAGFKQTSVATVDRSSSFYTDYGINTDRLFMGDRNSYTGNADRHLSHLPAKYTGIQKRYGDAHAKPTLLSIHDREVLASTRRDTNHFADEIIGIWDQKYT